MKDIIRIEFQRSSDEMWEEIFLSKLDILGSTVVHMTKLGFNSNIRTIKVCDSLKEVDEMLFNSQPNVEINEKE